MADTNDRSPEALKDALIAVMEELAVILDPVPEGPLPPHVRDAVAAPLQRARELASELGSETGSTAAYLLTLDAIEQRVVGTATT